MLHLHDYTSMTGALPFVTDPLLRSLLSSRIDALISGEFNLISQTEFLVVEVGDTEEDIICHVGFSPLVEPIDGIRFGQHGFEPPWDWLERHEGWFEMIVTFGSTFAYVLFIQDADGTLPALRSLCRSFT
ncbi:hypothetical protein [Sphingomonas sp. IC4-52]|uniref:hypothetical protein n=1 Tax=Sphingomonas sp. IC4-52 TaxID=2887202 RepID=UPI001D130734|nr:hypothetical protein [Sphingomonas sp. IC4-52]MCC2980049.1 hypothetical protein [Sphingomonas sp. IC4-52]